MKLPKTINYSLSLNDTSLIKGIAICFMLWHHLFYEHPEYGNLVYISSQIGKICVSLFLFLSAYGLTVQYNKLIEKTPLNSLKFQAHRFIKFYANYWIVFIFAVPIGVYIFGRSLEEAYSTNNVLMPFFRDVLGINYLKSYNTTWWFNTLIICCYAIFPILYIVVKKNSLIIFILVLIFHLIPVYLEFPIIELMKTYLLIFLLGIIYAVINKDISKLLNKVNPYILIFLLTLSFILLSILRQKNIIPGFGGMKVDPFLTLIIVLISMIVLRGIPFFYVSMQYLGKHSMNIYMIHTFIYYYFFSEFIYSFEYPILIFIVLLALSLGISVIIEFLKKIMHFTTFVKNISNLIK